MRGLQSLLVFTLTLVSGVAYAYTSPGAPDGYVNDFADVLTPAEEIQLEQELSNIEASSGAEIAVVIVTDLGGDTIENYAVQLFSEWGIGKKGVDNGVLLLASLNERGLRIEVGYGLEGDLTDAESYAIINNIITPQFASGDYSTGISSGIAEIARALNVEIEGGVIAATADNTRPVRMIEAALILTIIAAFLMRLFTSLGYNSLIKLFRIGVAAIVGVMIYMATNSVVFSLIAIAAAFFILLFNNFSGGSGGGSSFGGSSRSGGSFGGGRSGGGGASGRW